MATLGDLFRRFGLKNIKIKAGLVEAEISFNDHDKTAAWELYVELLTRITTQPLPAEAGDEKTALDSVYALFSITRTILKNNTADCVKFARIAVVVLNQVVRPFTAKWHKLSIEKAFEQAEQRKLFRAELEALQGNLKSYTKILAEIAGVEDLTDLEE